ncbi:transporter substrate-binding domain-containing protein [Pseudomonas schmalbachii]|uniref:histidine kinase n=1 Tax=Pseudomonas schmalbachii TaxID=2816993 RepID=A0ABS3TTS2_9PSED|nr:transporter substrate-binding domain-containing protein [Pseudomonas schmalbachii]MBO3277023.1 transporter substrate-binding domain-containing protein [Pseudomonas schmalbachii]
MSSGSWRYVLGIFLAAVLLLPGAGPHAATSSLTLLARSTTDSFDVHLSESDWQWLSARKSLTVGVVAPDYPPLDITASGRDLEGITADYLGVLGARLGLLIQVRQFPDTDSAARALLGGKIDLLSRSTRHIAELPGVALSVPYFANQTVLVGRKESDENDAEMLVGKRIALVDRYFSPEEISTHFPRSTLVVFDSLRHALEAVSFGRADVYVGDAFSAQYLISQDYQQKLKILNFARFNGGGFGFALNASNTRLLDILDKALGSIPTQTRMDIQRRWQAGVLYPIAGQELNLAPREQKWLSQHPRPVLVVDQSLAPVTFLDSNQRLRGIVADLLDLIAARTGLRFEIQPATSIPEMLQRVRLGQASAIAALTPAPEREDILEFTRPYLSTSFIVVANKSDDRINSLDDLKGRRLAVPRGTVLVSYLREHYPEIQLVEVENNADAFPLLSERKVDAAVHLMAAANFLIPRHFNDLRIIATLDRGPGNFSFAVSRSEPELLSILNKALLAIAPDDQAKIISRWSSATEPTDSIWERYRTPLYRLLLAATLALAMFMLWNWRLLVKVRQRNRAEKELNYRLEFKRALINGIPLPVAVRDRSGHLLTCNRSYLEFTGLSHENARGSSLADIVWLGPQQAQELHDEYARIMKQGKPFACDRVIEMDGQTREVYDWVTPYRSPGGEVVGMVCGWVDVTERERLHHQLQIAKDQAEAASRSKSAFLATMSHEIRTPLSAVIGMLELALANTACSRCLERNPIEVAYESAKTLLLLIGDILDVAKIEAGRLTLTPEPTRLRDLIDSVTRVFDGLARQKGLQLKLDMDPHADCSVLVDPLRFKQILSNLVSNAIKFTDTGEVRIHVTATPLADDRLELEVCVEDTGIGIAQHDIDQLFEPFMQARQTGHAARGGTGLGLPICLHLAKMMGGHLGIASEVGVGSRICVKLVLQEVAPVLASAESAAVLPESPQRPLRVLVVDDHPANRMLLAQQLEHLSHQVETADDGATALQAWHPGAFDLVITDCNMPVLSGYALAGRIREIEREAGIPPCLIFGLTANAQRDEIDRCRNAGMDDCLFKPIGLQALRERLEQIPRNAVEPTTPAVAPHQPIDDSEAVVVMQTLEEMCGHDTRMVRQLLRQLHDSNQADSQQIASLLDAGDWEGLADLAHRIKGAARLVRAKLVQDRCTALETACKDHAQENLLRDLAEQLLEALEQLQTHLASLLTSEEGKNPPAARCNECSL